MSISSTPRLERASKRCIFLVLASEDYGKTAGKLREDCRMPKPKNSKVWGPKVSISSTPRACSASKRCIFLVLASEDYGKTAGRLQEDCWKTTGCRNLKKSKVWGPKVSISSTPRAEVSVFGFQTLHVLGFSVGRLREDYEKTAGRLRDAETKKSKVWGPKVSISSTPRPKRAEGEYTKGSRNGRIEGEYAKGSRNEQKKENRRRIYKRKQE